MTTSLDEFIASNRDALIRRCQLKALERTAPQATTAELESGIPEFIDQITVELRKAEPDTVAIRSTAARHGRFLFAQGVTIGQVVHAYGDVCQALTGMAEELDAPMGTTDFRTLNRCLDDAIADAVSEFANQARRTEQSGAEARTLELRNLLFTAITSFEALQTGSLGVTGTTGFLLHRSLMAMRPLL